MPSIEYDLNFLQVGVVDIEGYLLSKELYYPVIASPPSGEPPYPRLTLGSLLLSLARLKPRSLDPRQETRLQQLSARLGAAKQKWTVAWEKKAAQEFGSRLTLWRNYIEDYREDPDGNVDRYGYEVNRRVMLELLKGDAGEIPDQELELLRGMDELLRAVLIPGDFIWEPELQEAFPPQPYWYLYGRPKEKAADAG